MISFYPYICLTIFTLGLIARYMGTPGAGNARSSNLFAKKSLMTGSYIFHYAIILAFFGHIIGLPIPQAALADADFSPSVHAMVASFAGKILAPCVFAGLLILLWRPCAGRRVWASTVFMDLVVILVIMWQSGTGGYQDYISHYGVFTTVAPWIRGVLL